jgi:hypothetical protein
MERRRVVQRRCEGFYGSQSLVACCASDEDGFGARRHEDKIIRRKFTYRLHDYPLTDDSVGYDLPSQETKLRIARGAQVP